MKMNRMMPRYDESPHGHSPLDRRDRRMKSPLPIDRRRRDSPPLPPPLSSSSSSSSRLSSRDHMLSSYHHDDYPSRPSSHRNSSSSSSDALTSTTYKILCVSNISNKYPDSTVRNELLKEFTRFGEPSIKLVFDKNTRLAYLYFANYEDAREARHAKSRLILFDKPVIIDPIYDRVSVSRKRSITPDYGPRQSTSLRLSSPPLQPRRVPPPPPPQPRSSINHERYQLSHPRDSYRDLHSHQLSSRSGGRDSYSHSSGGGVTITMRNQHHNQHQQPHQPHQPHHQQHQQQNQQQQNQNQQQQQRESKKEKFPNYLHHIPPEEDDKSTRTLFVGNLEVTITEPDLRRIFERYGVVEDVDVKRPPPGQGNAYAFIKFLNLDMAHRAKVEMSGQYIGKFQCKIGYGKATPTTRIWVGGLGPWTSFAQLDKEFDRFGAIRKIDFVKGDNHAYIQYDTIDAAQAACAAMRGYPLGGPDKRLRIDYADPGPFPGSPSRAAADSVGSFHFGHSPGSIPNLGLASNNNGQDVNASSSPKRRRLQSPMDGMDSRDKRSPHHHSSNNNNGNNNNSNNLSMFDSLTSPRGDANCGTRHVSASSPDFEQSNGGKSCDTMKVTINENVTTVQELIKCCAPVWIGGLILKSSGFATRAYFCKGEVQMVEMMKDSTLPTAGSAAAGSSSGEHSMLRITQRLRLETSKLDDVTRRIKNAGPGGHCVMIATQAQVPLNFANCTPTTTTTTEPQQKSGENGGSTEASTTTTTTTTTSTDNTAVASTGDAGGESAPSAEVTSASAGTGGAGGDETSSNNANNENNNVANNESNTSNANANNANANANANVPPLQQRAIRNLVTYLKSKDAAGVVLLPPKPDLVIGGVDQQPAASAAATTTTTAATAAAAAKGVLYLFPPHPFSVEMLQKIAPNIAADTATREDFLVMVLVRDPTA